ncbi:hypothetical protein CS063_01640 [Sporanaerobium hydrogeniformans]|uniref:Uncharacterized protein n=1 Tax=Sporanaerobium hydrogeniformans TaxID=3072179 RepID=A0AC61DHE2_9FIRM|nr:hypothetical protein [Sporanaerobium hydrogeniformans]PHV72203.1 hypothetical protein CS063_01640 [Sporanaerobium hydrogeniformans]
MISKLKISFYKNPMGFIFTVVVIVFLLILGIGIVIGDIEASDSGVESASNGKMNIVQTNNEANSNLHCDVKDCISVELIGSDGKQLYIDKGITKDKLAYEEDIYLSVENTSQDCKFVGSIYIDGAGFMGQYGGIEIMPGAAQQLKYTIKNSNTKYQIDGQMVQVLNNDILSKYKILASKIKTGIVDEDKYIRVGIEIPDDFDVNNPIDVLSDFLDIYTKSYGIEEIIIYIYEKGYAMKNTSDMYKNALYAITAYVGEEGYSYDVEDLKNDKILFSGELKIQE